MGKGKEPTLSHQSSIEPLKGGDAPLFCPSEGFVQEREVNQPNISDNTTEVEEIKGVRGGAVFVVSREKHVKVAHDRPMPHDPRAKRAKLTEEDRSERRIGGPIDVRDREKKPVHFPSKNKIKRKNTNPIVNTFEKGRVPGRQEAASRAHSIKRTKVRKVEPAKI